MVSAAASLAIVTDVVPVEVFTAAIAGGVASTSAAPHMATTLAGRPSCLAMSILFLSQRRG